MSGLTMLTEMHKDIWNKRFYAISKKHNIVLVVHFSGRMTTSFLRDYGGAIRMLRSMYKFGPECSTNWLEVVILAGVTQDQVEERIQMLFDCKDEILSLIDKRAIIYQELCSPDLSDGETQDIFRRLDAEEEILGEKYGVERYDLLS